MQCTRALGDQRDEGDVCEGAIIAAEEESILATNDLAAQV
jgi:hypothetical protein